MDHAEFVNGYRAGSIKARVDRNAAGHVIDRSPRMPARYRAAHKFWSWSVLLLIGGGLISLFWVPWWAGLGAAVLGFFIAPAAQKSATQFVLEHALADAEFFREMLSSGVLKVDRAS